MATHGATHTLLSIEGAGSSVAGALAPRGGGTGARSERGGGGNECGGGGNGWSGAETAPAHFGLLLLWGVRGRTFSKMPSFVVGLKPLSTAARSAIADDAFTKLTNA